MPFGGWYCFGFLDFYSQKYPNYSIYRALMSLTYFADADPKEMPTMFEEISWEDMKVYIKQQVASYERNHSVDVAGV